MKTNDRLTRFAFLFILLIAIAQTAAAQSVHFKIGIDPSLVTTTESVSGRLLIFMRKDDGKPSTGFGVDDGDPNAVWISGTEVRNLDPAKPLSIDADALSFPSPFSTAPAGNYQIFALLDRDHSYTYNGPGAGDIKSGVIKVSMPQTTISIDLKTNTPGPKPPMHPSMRLVEFESPMLSAFWGRPIMMQASVSLPPSYDSNKQTYPTVYKVSGYGGTHLNALYDAEQRYNDMRDGKRPEMITVFLEAEVPLGHHEEARPAL